MDRILNLKGGQLEKRKIIIIVITIVLLILGAIGGAVPMLLKSKKGEARDEGKEGKEDDPQPQLNPNLQIQTNRFYDSVVNFLFALNFSVFDDNITFKQLKLVLIETYVDLSLLEEDIVSVTILPLTVGSEELTQVLYVIQPEFDPNETDKFITVTSGIIIENTLLQDIIDNDSLKLAIQGAIANAVSSIANKPPFDFAYEQNNNDVLITFKIELKNPDYVSVSEQQFLNDYIISSKIKIFKTELDSVKNYIEDFLKNKSSDIESDINNYDDSDDVVFSVNENVIVEDDVIVVTEAKTLESHAEDYSPKLKQAT